MAMAIEEEDKQNLTQNKNFFSPEKEWGLKVLHHICRSDQFMPGNKTTKLGDTTPR